MCRASGSGCQHDPGKAQMTIFYASMVNVYDDVPFDLVSHTRYLIDHYLRKKCMLLHVADFELWTL